MVSRSLYLFARSRVRLGQHRSLAGGLCRLADQRSAVAVACSCEGGGHVAAEERDVGHVRTIANRKGAAGMVGVGRAVRCGLCALCWVCKNTCDVPES